MSKLSCPVCKSDGYLNPNLTLLVSPCFHKMCTTCINRLFNAGPSPCPICKEILRKSSFVKVQFEDVWVEREIDVRSKLSKIFNKKALDFKTLTDYNNYLEMVEDFVFNLVNQSNLEETRELISKYKQENKESIHKNNTALLKESQSISFKLEREKKEKILRKEALLKELKDAKESQNSLHESFINQLAQATDQESCNAALQEFRSNLKTQNHELILEEMVDNFQEEQDDWIIDEINQNSWTVLNNYLDPWTAHLKTPEKSVYIKACGYTPVMTYERSLSCAFGSVLVGLED